MAEVATTHEWNNAAEDRDWRNHAKWSPDPGAGNYPGDGATVQFLDISGYIDLPAINLLDAGQTLNVVLQNTEGVEIYLTHCIGGEGAVAGDVTLLPGYGNIRIDLDMTGALAIGEGTSEADNGVDIVAQTLTIAGPVTVDAFAYFNLDLSGEVGSDVTVTNGVVLRAGSTLSMDTSILRAAVSCTGACTVMLWESLGTIIEGSFDANGNVVAVVAEPSEAVQPILRLTKAGNLDLGTDGAGGPSDWSHIAVTRSGAVQQIIQGDYGLSVYGLDASGGGTGATSLVLNDKPLTVHEGGANAPSGTYVSTCTGSVVTFAADTAVCQWNDANHHPGCIVINADVKMSGILRANSIAGTGTLDLNSLTMIMYPDGADFWEFWTLGPPILNTGGGEDGYIQLRGSGETNTGLINFGAAKKFEQAYDGSQFNYPGGITGEGLFVLRGTSPQVAKADMAGGNLNVLGVVLGETSSTRLGRLDLGEGKHTVGPDGITRAGTGAQVLNFESCALACGGNITLAGIAASLGQASIVNGGILNGATATSIAALGAHVHGGTVTNLAVNADKPVYRFGGTGDAGNGAGVIQMPAPSTGTAPAMAA